MVNSGQKIVWVIGQTPGIVSQFAPIARVLGVGGAIEPFFVHDLEIRHISTLMVNASAQDGHIRVTTCSNNRTNCTQIGQLVHESGSNAPYS